LRERLSEAGPRQAACFSQAAYLDRLEAMYTAVLAGAPRLYKPIGIPGVK
jgi:hypothetical protein